MYIGIQDVATICSLCNQAELEYREGQYGRIGEPTEAALKVLVEKIGIPGFLKSFNPAELIRQYNDRWGVKYQRLAILEFDRDRKSMGVLCRNTGGGGNVLFVKGAAEVLITR
jgi:Ca2+-transporting ATPase